MKIAVVNNGVPFLYGGAEFLADSLRDKFIEHGHQATVIRVPFKWAPPGSILEHMLACRLLRLENVDRVVALKFPAYYIPHPNKVLWLLHQFRQAYDLWETPYNCIPKTSEGLRIREAITQADKQYLPEAKAIYTNNQVVSDRLKKYTGLESSVLFPPLMDAQLFFCRDYQDYIFYPSRINRSKRQHLAIESMKYTKTQVKLVVAGSPDNEEELRFVEGIIEKNNLGGKVKLISTFISQQEKADWFAGALGNIYIPYDEDSYGYVTLEAYHSKKAVISCTDSGGTKDVVFDDETGYMVAPDPRAIAEAMDKLYQDKAHAQALGEAGWERLETMGITWDNVMRRLLA
jgi:glycosyltransferase involved in cell wall biosynthesis